MARRNARNALNVRADNEMAERLQNSSNTATISGVCTFIGGCLGGPTGEALGGVLGAVAAAGMSSEKVIEVLETIRNLPPEKWAMVKKVINGDVGGVFNALISSAAALDEY